MPAAPKMYLAEPLSLWNRQESSTSPLEFLVEPAQSKKKKKKRKGLHNSQPEKSTIVSG